MALRKTSTKVFPSPVRLSPGSKLRLTASSRPSALGIFFRNLTRSGCLLRSFRLYAGLLRLLRLRGCPQPWSLVLWSLARVRPRVSTRPFRMGRTFVNVPTSAYGLPSIGAAARLLLRHSLSTAQPLGRSLDQRLAHQVSAVCRSHGRLLYDRLRYSECIRLSVPLFRRFRWRFGRMRARRPRPSLSLSSAPLMGVRGPARLVWRRLVGSTLLAGKRRRRLSRVAHLKTFRHVYKNAAG